MKWRRFGTCLSIMLHVVTLIIWNSILMNLSAAPTTVISPTSKFVEILKHGLTSSWLKKVVSLQVHLIIIVMSLHLCLKKFEEIGLSTMFNSYSNAFASGIMFCVIQTMWWLERMSSHESIQHKPELRLPSHTLQHLFSCSLGGISKWRGTARLVAFTVPLVNSARAWLCCPVIRFAPIYIR